MVASYEIDGAEREVMNTLKPLDGDLELPAQILAGQIAKESGSSCSPAFLILARKQVRETVQGTPTPTVRTLEGWLNLPARWEIGTVTGHRPE